MKKIFIGNDPARSLMGTIFLVVRQYRGFYCIQNPEGPAVESEHSKAATRDLRDFKCRRI